MEMDSGTLDLGHWVATSVDRYEREQKQCGRKRTLINWSIRARALKTRFPGGERQEDFQNTYAAENINSHYVPLPPRGDSLKQDGQYPHRPYSLEERNSK